MIDNKIVLDGTIVSVGDWSETIKGGMIRDFNVNAEANRMHYFCLTQHCAKDQDPWDIKIGESYRFEGYTNGIIIKGGEREFYVNKILVTRIWKPVL